MALPIRPDSSGSPDALAGHKHHSPSTAGPGTGTGCFCFHFITPLGPALQHWQQQQLPDLRPQRTSALGGSLCVCQASDRQSQASRGDMARPGQDVSLAAGCLGRKLHGESITCAHSSGDVWLCEAQPGGDGVPQGRLRE